MNRIGLWKLGKLLLGLLAPAAVAHACTIFVLTDGKQVLFFNNEDYSNPRTRIWFEPASSNLLGVAYVGFDNGWGQGGVNTAGLAYDWVAGIKEEWEQKPGMKLVRGNPAQRMLEQCSNVDQAIEFFRNHWEPAFAYARIMIADRTGASAIIGALRGQLDIRRSDHSQGFGYGNSKLQPALKNNPGPTLENGFEILRSCEQPGEFSTKYSTAFDLVSGDIHIRVPGGQRTSRLNLAAELRKPAHYYDIPQLEKQVSAKIQPLLNNMRRFPVDPPADARDPKPELTARLTGILQRAVDGKLDEHDYTPELWNEIRSSDFKEQLAPLGPFSGLTFIDTRNEFGKTISRYRSDFERAVIVQRFEIEENGKISLSETETVEWKAAPAVK